MHYGPILERNFFDAWLSFTPYLEFQIGMGEPRNRTRETLGPLLTSQSGFKSNPSMGMQVEESCQ